MINSGEVIYYIEYLDHAKIYSDPEETFKKPFTLWCVGKIFKESDDYIAVVCSGTKARPPNTEPSYEIVLKSAIIKKEVVHIVE